MLLLFHLQTLVVLAVQHYFAVFAKSYLQNYATGHVVRWTPARSIAGVVKWKPPSVLAVKVNFDGAMFGESDCAGLGVVVCNSKGAVLAALSEKIVKPQSAELVEILAAQHAVLFSSELGFQNLIVEGDSSSVIKLLQDRCLSHFQGGHILKDIMSHLDSFVSCSFSHVGRQGNAVAHALAQPRELDYIFPLRLGRSMFLQPFLLLYFLTLWSNLLMIYFSFSKKKKNF